MLCNTFWSRAGLGFEGGRGRRSHFGRWLCGLLGSGLRGLVVAITRRHRRLLATGGEPPLKDKIATRTEERKIYRSAKRSSSCWSSEGSMVRDRKGCRAVESQFDSGLSWLCSFVKRSYCVLLGVTTDGGKLAALTGLNGVFWVASVVCMDEGEGADEGCFEGNKKVFLSAECQVGSKPGGRDLHPNKRRVEQGTNTTANTAPILFAMRILPSPSAGRPESTALPGSTGKKT